jgi:hypothetical protein
MPAAHHLSAICPFCQRLTLPACSYAAKVWTRHERRSALARAITESYEYILPARFDETDLPGLQPTIAYLDLREVAPATLIEYLLEKLGQKVDAQ